MVCVCCVCGKWCDVCVCRGGCVCCVCGMWCLKYVCVVCLGCVCCICGIWCVRYVWVCNVYGMCVYMCVCGICVFGCLHTYHSACGGPRTTLGAASLHCVRSGDGTQVVRIGALCLRPAPSPQSRLLMGFLSHLEGDLRPDPGGPGGSAGRKASPTHFTLQQASARGFPRDSLGKHFTLWWAVSQRGPQQLQETRASGTWRTRAPHPGPLEVPSKHLG